MWPFSSANIIDQSLAQRFGTLQTPPIQSQDLPALGQPQPAASQAAPGNSFLSNPSLMNALGRMGSAMLISSGRTANFGESLGYGFNAFQDTLDAQQKRGDVLGQNTVENAARSRQLDILQQNADANMQEARLKMASGPFGGNSPASQAMASKYLELTSKGVPEIQARMQAVEYGFSRFKTGFDPVSGEQVTLSNGIGERGGFPGMPSAPQASGQPLSGEDAFVASLRHAESGGHRYDPRTGQLLTSDKGAMGEMQVMPATMRDPGYGVMPARDTTPTEIARVGDDYARMLYRRYKGDARLAAAAYNGGPGAMDRRLTDGRGIAGMPQESQSHARKVAGGIGFTPTGNPKVDAALQQKAAEADMDVQTERAKSQQTNQGDLAKNLDNGQYMMSVVDQALAPGSGLDASTGGWLGLKGRAAQSVPLTEAQRRFAPIAAQLQGQTFLQAYQNLKGGGQITEVEGSKAEAAIARLQQYQSPKDYRAALNELKGIIQRGMDRAKASATMTPDQQAEMAVRSANSAKPQAGLSGLDMDAINAERKRRKLIR